MSNYFILSYSIATFATLLIGKTTISAYMNMIVGCLVFCIFLKNSLPNLNFFLFTLICIIKDLQGQLAASYIFGYNSFSIYPFIFKLIFGIAFSICYSNKAFIIDKKRSNILNNILNYLFLISFNQSVYLFFLDFYQSPISIEFIFGYNLLYTLNEEGSLTCTCVYRFITCNIKEAYRLFKMLIAAYIFYVIMSFMYLTVINSSLITKIQSNFLRECLIKGIIMFIIYEKNKVQDMVYLSNITKKINYFILLIIS